MITSRPVWQAAALCKKDYVDAFGLQPEYAAGKHTVVRCGCVPGFLEVLIKDFCTSGTKEIYAWSGGKEKGSPAALGDIILSSINGYSASGAYAQNGQTIRCGLSPETLRNQTEEAFELSGNAYVAMVTTKELLCLSKQTGQTIKSYNIWADAGVGQSMASGCMMAARCGSDEEKTKLFADLFAQMEAKDKAGESSEGWYILHVKAVDENFSENDIHIETKNSTLITAGMLAYSVAKLSEGKIGEGISRPFEFADAGELLERYERMGMDIQSGGCI